MCTTPSQALLHSAGLFPQPMPAAPPAMRLSINMLMASPPALCKHTAPVDALGILTPHPIPSHPSVPTTNNHPGHPHPMQVPSFADISSAESLLGAPNIAGNMLPMRLLPLERLVKSPGQLSQLMGAYKGRAYMLAYLPGEQLPWWHVERWLYHYRWSWRGAEGQAWACCVGALGRGAAPVHPCCGCRRQLWSLHTTYLSLTCAHPSHRLPHHTLHRHAGTM
jgi:hypothetical protein